MNIIRVIAGAALAVVLAATDIDFEPSGPVINLLGGPAQARPGHPLTPLSYAGVARRTARRVARRTAYRVATLPGSCVYGVYYGGHYYNCGGVYYERSGGTYVQIIIE